MLSLRLLKSVIWVVVGFACLREPATRAFAAEPKPYEIAKDLSNVNKSKKLDFLSPAEKAQLARDHFVILPSPANHFYDIYKEPVAPPFVTADSMFHAFRFLFSRDLRQIEEEVFSRTIRKFAIVSFEAMKELSKNAPTSLQPAARNALFYLAVLARIADTKVDLDGSLLRDVEMEVQRVRQAHYIGSVRGYKNPRDYTQYAPIAGYEKTERLQRYFRLNRYMALNVLDYETDEEVQTCVLISMAVSQDKAIKEVFDKYINFIKLVAGSAQTPGPDQVFEIARSVLGAKMSLDELAKPDQVKRIRDKLWALPRPYVADQPQEEVGADPEKSRGMRLLNTGVTLKALVFQKLFEKIKSPSGIHMAYLMGNDLPGLRKTDQALLTPFQKQLAQTGDRWPAESDLHTAVLHTLSLLSEPYAKGAPLFMRTPAWQSKTANAQLGGWAEIEHDLFLYTTIGGLSRDAGPDATLAFPGYIEPVPRFYAAVAKLAKETGKAFSDLRSIFSERFELFKEEKESILVGMPKLSSLEDLPPYLDMLEKLAKKELDGELFSAEEAQSLKYSYDRIKRFLGDEQEMSTVVPVFREYSHQEGHYVGVGRPLKILVVVPWAGKLEWCQGGVYSYYELSRSLTKPLTDSEWATLTTPPVKSQRYKPWLFDSAPVRPVIQGKEQAFSEEDAYELTEKTENPYLKDPQWKEGWQNILKSSWHPWIIERYKTLEGQYRTTLEKESYKLPKELQDCALAPDPKGLKGLLKAAPKKVSELLGLCYLSQGKSQEADIVFHHLITNTPKDPEKVFWQEGMVAAAILSTDRDHIEREVLIFIKLLNTPHMESEPFLHWLALQVHKMALETKRKEDLRLEKSLQEVKFFIPHVKDDQIDQH